ncbi:hypothetical protein D9619_007561 [Psilocybe cf. subviscida]|uniref:DUF5648 domain-containing protein n=1 Tax=Psilocybe cf. subviscida TaxID=2480587 RepID=A0A8H5B3D2_9AGAR|nr:hypothetical protein D9619_007561 [Psilocybe cf. subviscida]
MRSTTFTALATMAVSLSMGLIGVTAAPIVEDDIQTLSARSCANASLARVIYQGYSSTSACHVMNFLYAFVHDSTILGPVSTGARWSLQGATFKAWATQQASTLPLYRLGTSTGSDYIFELGTVDPMTQVPSPPTVTGFNNNIGLTAWVYGSATCDSVALLSAAHTTMSDHFYTTDADEHAGLIANGWTDAGVVAYVLPL